MRRFSLMTAFILTGCWNTDPTELPADQVDFTPEYGAKLDWQIQSYDLGLTCPDGEQARYYFISPKKIPEEPMPAAVIYHSGSFDYVHSPDWEEPLLGQHYQTVESRLSQEWSIRRVFVMLGMFPEDDPYEYHLGSLPGALAEQGVVSLIPINCWGDLWHNRAFIAENTFSEDRFFRNGRVSAEWGWQILVDEIFAYEQGIELPVTIDTTRVYAFGLGEGGRAVNELLAADNNNDGIPDFSPAGVLLDSSPDDLRAYYDNPLLYSDVVSGLNRIFPAGSASTTSTSLAFIPTLPPRVAYIYSAADTRLPATTHDAAVARLTAAGMLVKDVAVARHILTNADDLTLTRETVAYVVGAQPAGGDTGGSIP